ncbi:MAG: hypothetical protein HYX68_11175 [Planctomycetes bacterium]|nr:hypothetical protein [Planctomycetota bacterium]
MRWFTRGFACFAFLAAVLLAAADSVPTTAAAAAGGKDKKEGHHEIGPRGGPVAEWGDEKYHVEIIVDHSKKTATAYILGGDIKKASPIAAASIKVTFTSLKPALQVVLKADPDKGDPKGSSSRFVGMHDKLGQKFKLKGSVSGKVGDLPYAGDFELKEKKK